MHGGAAPAVRAAAAAREAEQAAGELLATIWKTDAAPVTNPVAALQALAGRLQHAADALGSRMGDELDQVTAAAWLRVLRELRQSLEGMERLDLAGKQLQLERDQARMVGVAIEDGLAAIGASPDQRDVFVRILMGRLRTEESVAPVRGEVER